MMHDTTCARNPRAAKHLRCKRIIDLALAIGGLAVAAPLLGPIALAIKLDSPGPVVFAQERLGRDRRPFRVLKLRTMVCAAPRHHVGAGSQQTGATWPGWTQPDDPRVTRIGRILRAVHLDELPQLVNVLRGEMSIVGPRPILEREAAHFEAPDARFVVLPGITGLAQVSVHREEHAAKFALDAEYVTRQSLWLDLKIILLTVGMLLRVAKLTGLLRFRRSATVRLEPGAGEAGP